ncbi:MAG: hypothetical protein ACPLPX_06290 [Candidatus Kapaibacteriota bacterium]
MRHLFFVSAILSILLIGYTNSQTLLNLRMDNEREEKFKEEREKWLRSLHRCEEGLPYWIIDQTTKKNIQANLDYSKNELTSGNEFAEGRIKGEWKEKGSDNLAGRVHTLDYDTNTKEIFLASAGGNIWKGSINGNDWLCLNNGKKFANPRMVKILAIGGKRRVVVAANSPSAIYYTDNDGVTWQNAKGLDNAEKWGWIIRGTTTINQEIYILLAEWDYSRWKSLLSLYKSIDYGEHFIKIHSVYLDYDNYDFCDIWSPRYDKNITYFALKDTLYTIDSQNNLKLVSINSFVDKYTSGIQIKGTTNGEQVHIYIAKRNTSVQTEFHYSSDGGKNFIYKGKLDFYSFEKNSFEVSQTFPNFIYFGQVEFYRSSNFGTNWLRANKWSEYYGNEATKLHADIPGIVSFRKWNANVGKFDETLFVCTDGGLYVSYDNGKSFKNLSLKNLNISQYYSVYTFDKSVNAVFAGSQDQGLQFCLNDSGKILSFNQVISGDYGHLSSSNGGRFLWTTYPGFAMIVFNPQTGYFNAQTWDFRGGGFLWLPPIYADPDNPKRAYLISGSNSSPNGTPASYIYSLLYDDKADTISYEVLPFNFAMDDVNRKISSLSISQLNTNLWFALTNDGKFFRSSDRAINWTLVDNVAGPKSHYFYGNKILTSNINIGKVVIAGSGYSNPGVLISFDTGKTFTPLNRGLPSTLFYDIEFNEDESLLFAATEIGPFVYHFAEQKWYFLGGGNCPDNIFWDVEYLPSLKTVRYATYGRGIWDFKIEQVLSLPESQPKAQEELNVIIRQNHTSNEFIFEVHSRSGDYIRAAVYDIEGRLVKTLWDGTLMSDLLQIEWNSTSNAGIPLPSGKYFAIFSHKTEVEYISLIIDR